ncbi:MAG: hypothetical protein JWP52_4581 [Rhizobacter sp.]|nr:hypothetical protein [Rhizobacter sp.]
MIAVAAQIPHRNLDTTDAAAAAFDEEIPARRDRAGAVRQGRS